MDELHAQLVTLKAVKTAGPLMTHLEKKLSRPWRWHQLICRRTPVRPGMAP